MLHFAAAASLALARSGHFRGFEPYYGSMPEKEGLRPEGDLHPDLARQESAGGLGTSGRVALAVFAAAAAYFLWTEHRAHVIQYLPWGILALCPLMHFFMHRGHGGHGSRDSGSGSGRGGREA